VLIEINDMKNICFLIGNLNSSGGTERVTSLIANKLVEIDYNISILSLVGGDNPFFTLNDTIKNYFLYANKVSFKKNFVHVIYKIRKFIKKQKIDTLIVVDSISCAFTVPALAGLDVNHICWEHFNFHNDLGKSARKMARQLAARYCDSVVTLTERDKQYWLKNTRHKSQITAIANPCPFPPQDYIKRENTKIVLAVGGLTQVKGFDMLLEAWIQVSSSMPEWKLVIVGEGEDRSKLTEFIKKNGLMESVDLVGNTSDVSKYYKEAEIFCLSSRFEGFPMVLLETLAFGLPVVSFDCDTGPAEILEDTGSILVPQNNINKLALSLLELMNDEKKRKIIGSKGKEKSEIYQPKNIIKQWIELLDFLE
jgi:glycosyltransferase involved in cell wall biosynthesis